MSESSETPAHAPGVPAAEELPGAGIGAPGSEIFSDEEAAREHSFATVDHLFEEEASVSPREAKLGKEQRAGDIEATPEGASPSFDARGEDMGDDSSEAPSDDSSREVPKDALQADRSASPEGATTEAHDDLLEALRQLEAGEAALRSETPRTESSAPEPPVDAPTQPLEAPDHPVETGTMSGEAAAQGAEGGDGPNDLLEALKQLGVEDEAVSSAPRQPLHAGEVGSSALPPSPPPGESPGITGMGGMPADPAPHDDAAAEGDLSTDEDLLETLRQLGASFEESEAFGIDSKTLDDETTPRGSVREKRPSGRRAGRRGSLFSRHPVLAGVGGVVLLIVIGVFYFGQQILTGRRVTQLSLRVAGQQIARQLAQQERQRTESKPGFEEIARQIAERTRTVESQRSTPASSEQRAGSPDAGGAAGPPAIPGRRGVGATGSPPSPPATGPPIVVAQEKRAGEASSPTSPSSQGEEVQTANLANLGTLGNLAENALLEGLQTITSGLSEGEGEAGSPQSFSPPPPTTARSSTTDAPFVASVSPKPERPLVEPSADVKLPPVKRPSVERISPRGPVAPRGPVESVATEILVRPDPLARQAKTRRVAPRPARIQDALATSIDAPIEPAAPANAEERRKRAKSHFLYGASAHRLGRVSRAVAEYHSALWLDPNRVDAWNNLGVALRDRRRFVRSVVAYQHALELQPHFARAHHNLGEIYFLAGDMASAVQEYQQALKFDPTSLETHLNLAVIYRRQERLQEAETSLKSVLKINPSQPEAYYNLAQVYELSGEPARAIDAYEQFLKLSGARLGALASRVRRHLQSLKKPSS